ncbi:UDP-glucose 4-epimerase [Streptomyces sp. V3I8]|jgi:hypothetical protein|nr:UDP-glucose 4-epimerase [Streptomyces sp. V3I8]
MSGQTWRRALVTGGAGFVESHPCGRLLGRRAARSCGWTR